MLKRKVIKGSAPTGAPKPTSANANAKPLKQQQAEEEMETPNNDEVEEPIADALSAAFDSVPLSSSASEIAPGKYEAIVTRITLQAPDSKGRSVRANFDLCSPKFENKNQLVTWFKILENNLRTPVAGGVKALKIMLGKLGYDPRGSEMEQCFAEITNEQPGVMVNISYQEGNDGVTYQRIIVDGLCDNEVVEAYKDNIPY